MASSASSAASQPGKETRCNLCSHIDTVYWFCKNCIKTLCENCRSTHFKIPSCSKHEIVPVEEAATIQNSFCIEHGNSKNYGCFTCKTEICLDCCQTTHKEHEVMKIENADEKQNWRLKKLVKTNIAVLNNLKQMQILIDDNKISFDENIDMMLENIQDRFQQITDHKDVLLRRLEEERKVGHVKMERQLKFVTEHEIRIRQTEETPGNASSTFTFDLPTSSKFKTSTTDDELCQMFSYLHPRSSRKVNTVLHDGHPIVVIDLHVVSKLHISEYEISVVSSISPTNNDAAWIASHDAPLRLLTTRGKTGKQADITPCAVYTALLSTNEIVVSSGDSPSSTSQIRRITQDGSVSVIADFPKYKAIFGLCVTQHDDIVCVSEVSESKGYKLVRLNKKGKIKWKRSIGKIRSNSKNVCVGPYGNLYVNMGTELCVVDSKGKIIEKRQFDPRMTNTGPIACSSHDHIVVTVGRNILFMFNQKSQHYASCILTEERGHIESLAFDNKERLWIGTNSGWVYVTKNE